MGRPMGSCGLSIASASMSPFKCLMVGLGPLLVSRAEKLGRTSGEEERRACGKLLGTCAPVQTTSHYSDL